MVRVALGLYLLATLDCTLTGFRAAAGRSGLVRKRRFVAAALGRGFWAGQLAVVAGGVPLAAWLLLSSDRAALWADLERAGGWLLQVYVPYAVIILATFVVRGIPSVDVRSITSVLFFGPLTFLRPPVLAAGLVLGVIAVPRPGLGLYAAWLLVLMLLVEPGLRRLPVAGEPGA